MADKDAFLDPDYVRFYDWTASAREEQVPFYARLARENDGPVMEAGCGTGRLSLALAREGFRVVGFDPSPQALEVARNRLREEPEKVQRRVSYVAGDIQKFDLGEQFALATVPHSAVFRLSGRHSLLQCFRVLYEHTQPGGTAVVDAVAPEQMKGREIGSERKVAEGVNPATGLQTKELQRVTGIAWDMQTLRVEHDFVEVEKDEERRFSFRRDYRWLERDEATELLGRVGFPEVEVLGDYDGSPYTAESPRLIVIAGRLERDFR